MAGKVVRANIPEGKEIVSTQARNVISNTMQPLTQVAPCTQEEADGRLLLHVADCVAQGLTNILVKTVDTDVVVLSVAFFHHLGLQQLWVEMGSGKHLRYIAAHQVAETLGKSKAAALPAFYAFSGCDTFILILLDAVRKRHGMCGKHSMI